MEPISAIAISLALGAGATAGKEVVGAVVKDAYGKLKTLIMTRYPKVSVEQLEAAPDSKNRRAVVEEDLTAAGAGQDAALLTAAHTLTELIQQHAPGVAGAIGVGILSRRCSIGPGWNFCGSSLVTTISAPCSAAHWRNGPNVRAGR